MRGGPLRGAAAGGHRSRGTGSTIPPRTLSGNFAPAARTPPGSLHAGRLTPTRSLVSLYCRPCVLDRLDECLQARDNTGLSTKDEGGEGAGSRATFRSTAAGGRTRQRQPPIPRC
eukprot:COSAG01_NODE_2811_length_7034_cov_2.875270_2_plen_115_part_00